jgi:hypothetical protein
MGRGGVCLYHSGGVYQRHVVQNLKRVIMKKIGFTAIAAVVLLFACAPVTRYPIHMRYAPEREGPQAQTALKGHVVTVARFIDKRGLADPTVIGTRTKRNRKTVPFVSSEGEPAANITEAVKTYLFERGYTVRGETPQWDLALHTIKPRWGDWVIGGAIEQLSVEVTSHVRTVYECTLVLKVAIARIEDAKTIREHTINLSSSYTTVFFQATTAERMVNKLIAQAIEHTLEDLEKQ